MPHALGNNYGKFYSFQSKPVWLDCKFTVDNTTADGTSGVSGQGVKAVYMHTATTASAGNPNPLAGYALIELEYNYTRNYGGYSNITPPLTGSNLAINASALTAHTPYVITAVGTGTAGACTIQPVADVAGSLASKYFSLYDAYGNTFIIWFSVSGVGSPPTGVSGTLVQQSISTGDTATTIGTALATTIAALPSGISGVFSFTTAGTTTVTCTSTTSTPLAGGPADGASPLGTGFTFALTKYTTNLQDWQQVGLPKGITPAVGVAFIATAVGYSTGGGSSGTVKAIGSANVNSIQILGDMNLSIAPIPMGGSANTGGYILLSFLSDIPVGTNDSATPPVFTGTAAAPAAPANGTVIRLGYLLEQAARVGGSNE